MKSEFPVATMESHLFFRLVNCIDYIGSVNANFSNSISNRPIQFDYSNRVRSTDDRSDEEDCGGDVQEGLHGRKVSRRCSGTVGQREGYGRSIVNIDLQVVYGDTDSVMVKFGVKTVAEVYKL